MIIRTVFTTHRSGYPTDRRCLKYIENKAMVSRGLVRTTATYRCACLACGGRRSRRLTENVRICRGHFRCLLLFGCGDEPLHLDGASLLCLSEKLMIVATTAIGWRAFACLSAEMPFPRGPNPALLRLPAVPVLPLCNSVKALQQEFYP